MKRKIRVFFLLFLCLGMFASADSVKPVNVNLNGKPVNCASYGQDATIVDGRTMVPLRAIFEALGADVIWDNDTRTVFSAKDGIVVSLTVGKAEIVKNKEPVRIDVPALIMNDRTLVPARAVAEAYGVSVEWDKDSRTVLLTTIDTSSGISRTGKIESPLDEHHAYDKFYFGMTMQECWDAVGKNDGEKELVSKTDGINEIHIQVKKTAEDSDNCKSIQLLFTDNYLYCVRALFGDESDIREFADKNVMVMLYGHDVKEESLVSVNSFLKSFANFDMKTASEYCTSPNSVRRTGILSAKDVVIYTGFDKEETVKNIIINSFAGNENYRAVAEALANPIEEMIEAALSQCTYSVEKCHGVSENEVEVDFSLNIPDISYLLSTQNDNFETALAKAFENGAQEQIPGNDEASEQEIISAIAPIIEKTLKETYMSAFEDCPSFNVTSKEKLFVVFTDDKWQIKADGEYVKKALGCLRMFE